MKIFFHLLDPVHSSKFMEGEKNSLKIYNKTTALIVQALSKIHLSSGVIIFERDDKKKYYFDRKTAINYYKMYGNNNPFEEKKNSKEDFDETKFLRMINACLILDENLFS